MSGQIDQESYRLLLQLILAQRLEMNAIEHALKSSGVLADSQVQEIRLQASKTAETWRQDESIDLLALIRIHSSPGATMHVPLSLETREELRREIDDQTP